MKVNIGAKLKSYSAEINGTRRAEKNASIQNFKFKIEFQINTLSI
jgi:hypothetical protein